MCEAVHGQQGHVFVCGDVRMARDVATALRALLARALHLSPQQADEYFQQLKVRSQHRPFPPAGGAQGAAQPRSGPAAAVSSVCAHRNKALRERLGPPGAPNRDSVRSGCVRVSVLLWSYVGVLGSSFAGC